MKPKTRAAILLAALVIALLAGGVVWAQTGGAYDLTWNTIDGGGATFSSGGTGTTYELGGTIGQADAGRLSAGAYELDGGFWGGAIGSKFTIYLPATMRK